MKRTITSLCIMVCGLLTLPHAAVGQTISGTVVESDTRQPIANVVIDLVESGGSSAANAVTDSVGAFVLRPAQGGAFAIHLMHMSYMADSVLVSIRMGEAIQLELRMGSTAVPLEPVVVTARRDRRVADFYDRAARSAWGTFLTREDLEQRPGAQPTDLIRMLPRVEVIYVRSAAGNIITMRGGPGGRCLPSVYLDGMPIGQADPIDRFLHVDMLEGVEIYTGMAGRPLEYGHSPCGAVAFHSRLDGGSRFTMSRVAKAAGVFAGMALLLGVVGGF